MRSSRAELHSRVHAIPEIRFDDETLTSCSGLVTFQPLFGDLDLRSRLRKCFRRLQGSSAYGVHTVFLLLVIHLLIGYRKLRDVEYYKDDPIVLRILGLRRLPDVATISRSLGVTDMDCCDAIEAEIRAIVLERLAAEACARVTLDFDGSVCGTRRHAEGSAVGYNTKRKGERSVYPLICTVAQTGQVLSVHQRPGNVHDSKESQEFIVDCFDSAIAALPRATFESRLDSAHFSEETACLLDRLGVEFSISVPFLRLPELKDVVEARRRWKPIDETWSSFELEWAPKTWISPFRFVVYRQKVEERRKGPLQLDIFEPRSWSYDYKVVITNKTTSGEAVLRFHNGRGSQESVIGELKAHCQFDYIPVRTRAGNRLFAQAAVLAHNLTRELQMRNSGMDRKTTATRAPHWIFETLGTMRNRIIRRAGRLSRPNGRLILTMSANKVAQEDILRFLDLAS